MSAYNTTINLLNLDIVEIKNYDYPLCQLGVVIKAPSGELFEYRIGYESTFMGDPMKYGPTLEEFCKERGIRKSEFSK